MKFAMIWLGFVGLGFAQILGIDEKEYKNIRQENEQDKQSKFILLPSSNYSTENINKIN